MTSTSVLSVLRKRPASSLEHWVMFWDTSFWYSTLRMRNTPSDMLKGFFIFSSVSAQMPKWSGLKVKWPTCLDSAAAFDSFINLLRSWQTHGPKVSWQASEASPQLRMRSEVLGHLSLAIPFAQNVEEAGTTLVQCLKLRAKIPAAVMSLFLRLSHITCTWVLCTFWLKQYFSTFSLED